MLCMSAGNYRAQKTVSTSQNCLELRTTIVYIVYYSIVYMIYVEMLFFFSPHYF